MSEVKVEKLRLGLIEFSRLRSDYEYRTDRYKLGKVLTVVDGTFADPEQRKAVKDLIHGFWYEVSNSPEIPIHPRESHLFEALTGEKFFNEVGLARPSMTSEFNPFTDKLNK